MAIGRISGPLLKSDLIRNEVDLAFETDLLYLKVTKSSDPTPRVGINTNTPQYDLDVNGTAHATNFIVDNQLGVGNLHITGNTISSDLGTISFNPSGGEATVYHSRLQVDDFDISGNVISTNVSNSSIELRPNGTGTIEIFSDTNIEGNLNVTGNIVATGDVTIGGNITIGDALTDTITINAAIKSDLIPETDDAHSLGSSSFRWSAAYVDNMYTDNLNLLTLDIGDLIFRNNEITTTAGQDLLIDGSGAGGVRLANFRFAGNTITNISNNAITQIAQTGTGYVKFEGTNGFVPPRGTELERPTAYAVQGMTRYNTVSKALEVWDGAAWASPAGASGAVSETGAQDIAIARALAFG